MKKIAAISLGCDKNRIDTENMLYLLKNQGFELTQDAEKADYILINTCGFIEAAKKESIDAILEMGELRKQGKKLVVTGCLVQRYAKDLFENMPEADLLIGINSQNQIADLVKSLRDERELKIDNTPKEYVSGRVVTTPYHYAYLRIADGCDNFCSYCAIPLIRGRYRSVSIESLIAEAKALIDEGVKEIILIAQDTTRYGKDIYGKPSLKELLRELLKLDVWKIRILYAYPELVDKELVDMISKEEKIAKYIDIPLQHIDDQMLKRMNRRTTEREILNLLNMIKDIDKDIAIRTTFIVGFNQEDKKKYEKLKSFIENNDYIDYAGFFGYSIEEGTKASKFVEGNVDSKEIEKRVGELERIWSQKIVENNKRYIGQTIEVIYEGIDYDKQMFWGRSEYQAPQIDTKVLFTAKRPLDVGDIYKVKITHSDFNLYGEETGE
ncbi:MAG: 30S ribosomal protein S12 methylthiotransferase RimO [Clostridia bacterium]|jgi:ribosomal protein S12 methylthiotransferase|nr:30S ribosomal protein S12 methylthiotransferase RimO [Clostridiales bacterium]